MLWRDTVHIYRNKTALLWTSAIQHDARKVFEDVGSTLIVMVLYNPRVVVLR